MIQWVRHIVDLLLRFLPNKSIKSVNSYLNGDLYFNSFVTIGLETIIEFSLTAFIWIKTSNYNESGEILGAAVAVHGLLCAYVCLPVAISLLFCRSETQEGEENKIDDVIGSMYEDNNIETNW